MLLGPSERIKKLVLKKPKKKAHFVCQAVRLFLIPTRI